MSHVSHYIKGEHLFECQRCGCVFHSHNKRKEWNGAIVCHGPGSNDCWEPRHPQDYVRGRADKQYVQDAAPQTTPVYSSLADLTWDDDTGAWS